MNKENKQIDTLKNDLMKSEFWRFDDESGRFELDRQNTARNLYKKGYRKASEVAAEIFEVIEEMLKHHYEEWDFCYYDDALGDDFAELKKKYTVTDTNVGGKTEGEG